MSEQPNATAAQDPDKGAAAKEKMRSSYMVGFFAWFVVGIGIACMIVIPVIVSTKDVCSIDCSESIERISLSGTNVCSGKKPTEGYENHNCTVDGVVAALEQAGTNVTEGYVGDMSTNATPITTTFLAAGMCPVNVHWHVGTEHLSVGQYDDQGTGPASDEESDHDDDDRRLVTEHRLGFQCHLYNADDSKFTRRYYFEHCEDMEVGQTYEVHWPHSAAGACGTPNQYQTPFYDGVFCRDGIITSTAQQIGVQAQVFTVVNDENYYYPNLMRGMIVEGDYGAEITKYTGSTTGTSRDNTLCSKYTPITWQVDRNCHLISASTFDKMCADMKAQRDDLSGDMHPHGSRELVPDSYAANNHDHD